MAFLVPDRILKIKVGKDILTINQKIIPDSMVAGKDICSYIKKGEPVKPCEKLGGDGKPRGITVHNTADIKVAEGTNAAEQYCRATYNGNMAGVVVHFYVYRGDIWQLLSEDECGWHATDGSSRKQSQRKGMEIGGNLDTIAIECIGDIDESEQTTAKLVAYLLDKHGLNPSTDVYTHNYFYAKKRCPLYILPHWDEFVANVSRIFSEVSDMNKPEPDIEDGVIYRVQVGAFSNKDNAYNYCEELKTKGINAFVVKVD